MKTGDGEAKAGQLASRTKRILSLVFILRCAGAGALSYWLSTTLDLKYPIWAAMTAVTIASDTIGKTGEDTIGQIGGTILGALVGALVVFIGGKLSAPVSLQVAAAIALCAVPTIYYYNLRLSMWSSLVILLTPPGDESATMIGFLRSQEIIFGSVIGATIHFLLRHALIATLGKWPDNDELA